MDCKTICMQITCTSLSIVLSPPLYSNSMLFSVFCSQSPQLSSPIPSSLARYHINLEPHPFISLLSVDLYMVWKLQCCLDISQVSDYCTSWCSEYVFFADCCVSYIIPLLNDYNKDRNFQVRDCGLVFIGW